MKKKFRNKNKNTQYNVNDIRYDQVYFQNGELGNASPDIVGSFPGSNYVDLGTPSKLYSELTSTRTLGQESAIQSTPILVEFGSIGTDDSGANWEVDSTDGNILRPNAAAMQVELKMGLIEAKIRNAMYTDLDILKYTPSVNTVLSGTGENTVIASGQLYTRYLLASKYNTYILAKYWATIQSTIYAICSLASRNKLLVDRANLLVNEMKRAKIRAALQSLETASTMVMTDEQIIKSVFAIHGVAKLSDSLLAPLMTVNASITNGAYTDPDTYLKIKEKGATKDSTELKLALPNDIEMPATLKSMVNSLFTNVDNEWVNTVQTFGAKVLASATRLTLAISSIQKPFQMFNTAMQQIGFEVLDRRFGFRAISCDIFGSPHIQANHILSLYNLKFCKLEFSTEGALSKTVTAHVPMTIEGRPIKEFQTNYVLSTVASPGDYQPLLNLNDFNMKTVTYLSSWKELSTGIKCTNMDAYIMSYELLPQAWTLFGLQQVPAVEFKAMNLNYLTRINHSKFLTKYIPFLGITLSEGNTLNMIPDRVQGMVEIAYAPILDIVLMKAPTNFGVVA